jgi:hypothetical protein
MSDEIERLFIGGDWHGKRIAMKADSATEYRLKRFVVKIGRFRSPVVEVMVHKSITDESVILDMLYHAGSQAQ